MKNTMNDVLTFWFEECDRKQWFQKSDDFDALIRDRFGALHEQASHCELAHWRDTARGRLAEIIVLDQFSRNLYRNSAKAFANDNLALALAQETVRQGQDKPLQTLEKHFLYMPYMHSESIAIHEQALSLFAQEGLEDAFNFEKRHQAIIQRFGRYPHRNEVLGRASTTEEMEFLKQPGSSF